MELFHQTKLLEEKINTFLNNIIHGGELLTLALNCYFKSGINSKFLHLKDKVSSLEAENDALRRDVENQLYAHLILPDMRSDILALIEGCDKIINKYETDLILISVEQPKIPQEIQKQLSHMIVTNIQCVGALMKHVKDAIAGKAETTGITDVSLLEHQVDLQAMDLKKTVFQDLKLPLARQLQLKEFIYSIEKISDMAEDMADSLSVFMVKHVL
ncbi:MAG: DUF47 family protein [Pseudomonadota bacterium]|nr:DUF47 family protein [Pseudomonadota bacterium]